MYPSVHRNTIYNNTWKQPRYYSDFADADIEAEREKERVTCPRL